MARTSSRSSLSLFTGGQMADTPEAQEEAMQAWGAWFGTLGDAVIWWQCDLPGGRSAAVAVARPAGKAFGPEAQLPIVARGDVMADLAVAPTRDALVYTRAGERTSQQAVWVSALDPKTGLAKGPERRLSAARGDVPAISPDGKRVAFARDLASGILRRPNVAVAEQVCRRQEPMQRLFLGRHGVPRTPQLT